MLILVAISSLIAVTWYLRISWFTQKPETGKATKKLTWRIRGIPVSTSKKHLQEQLAQGRSQKEVDIFSLARISRDYLCATVFCEEALLEKYNDEWVIDKEFIGITPLFDPDDAIDEKVE